jgi:drug/metabolite transporter (DMT)-like permease
VAGLITARIVLDERLSPIQWVGCLLVVAGLVVAFSSFIKWKSAVRSL